MSSRTALTKGAKVTGGLAVTVAVGVSLFVVLLSAILGIVAYRSASRIMRRLNGEYVPPVEPLGESQVIDVEYVESPER